MSDVNAAQPLQRWILKRKHIVNASHRKKYNQTSHENTESRSVCYCVSESVCVTIAMNATFALYVNEAIFGSVHDSYLIHKQNFDSWCHENGAGNACVYVRSNVRCYFYLRILNCQIIGAREPSSKHTIDRHLCSIEIHVHLFRLISFFFSSFYWYSKVMNGFDFKKSFNCDLVLFQFFSFFFSLSFHAHMDLCVIFAGGQRTAMR